ncbi:MAG: threonine synthase [Chloroflexota bacterium]|jgi:threonine dehydratase|nr:threonine synthase [Chloroflexota bacterium]
MSGTSPGQTPLEAADRLAQWVGLEQLWLKREDLNPTGSHKDRGAAAQVDACLARDNRVAVISSSGNAALAAAAAGTPRGVTVVALLSPLTEPAKVAAIRAAGGRVVVTAKPINYTIRLSRVCGWPDLRPSQSAEALAGFAGLGTELAGELEEGVAITGYASSGTTFQAVGAALETAGRTHPLHPVQAGLVNGLSREFGRPGDGRRSLVGDLGVKVSGRGDDVVRLVRDSGGEAWWVDDDAISDAGRALREAGHHVAPECWAALAGTRLAARAGLRRAALLLTGRALPPGEYPPLAAPLETFAEVLAALEDLRP